MLKRPSDNLINGCCAELAIPPETPETQALRPKPEALPDLLFVSSNLCTDMRVDICVDIHTARISSLLKILTNKHIGHGILVIARTSSLTQSERRGSGLQG